MPLCRTVSKRPIRRHIQEVKSWNKKRKNCGPRPAPTRWKRSRPSFISDGHPPILWSRKGTSRVCASAQPSGFPGNPLTSGWTNWNCNTEERTMATPWYAPLYYNQTLCLKNRNESFQHLASLHDIMNINQTGIFPEERR